MKRNQSETNKKPYRWDIFDLSHDWISSNATRHCQSNAIQTYSQAYAYTYEHTHIRCRIILPLSYVCRRMWNVLPIIRTTKHLLTMSIPKINLRKIARAIIKTYSFQWINWNWDPSCWACVCVCAFTESPRCVLLLWWARAWTHDVQNSIRTNVCMWFSGLIYLHSHVYVQRIPMHLFCVNEIQWQTVRWQNVQCLVKHWTEPQRIALMTTLEIQFRIKWNLLGNIPFDWLRKYGLTYGEHAWIIPFFSTTHLCPGDAVLYIHSFFNSQFFRCLAAFYLAIMRHHVLCVCMWIWLFNRVIHYYQWCK